MMVIVLKINFLSSVVKTIQAIYYSKIIYKNCMKACTGTGEVGCGKAQGGVIYLISVCDNFDKCSGVAVAWSGATHLDQYFFIRSTVCLTLPHCLLIMPPLLSKAASDPCEMCGNCIKYKTRPVCIFYFNGLNSCNVSLGF